MKWLEFFFSKKLSFKNKLFQLENKTKMPLWIIPFSIQPEDKSSFLICATCAYIVARYLLRQVCLLSHLEMQPCVQVSFFHVSHPLHSSINNVKQTFHSGNLHRQNEDFMVAYLHKYYITLISGYTWESGNCIYVYKRVSWCFSD